MELTLKELWTVIHGMPLGAIYLLAFTGGLADLWSLKPPLLTKLGFENHLKRLRIGMWMMTLISWLTVISGTYIVYPWYRDPSPESPRSILLTSSQLAEWHTFGMEWKEHIGWLSPLLMTCIAFTVTYYRTEIPFSPILRRLLILLFLLSFIFAGISAIFGAFITKIVPIH